MPFSDADFRQDKFVSIILTKILFMRNINTPLENGIALNHQIVEVTMSYLNYIKESVEKFYRHDSSLLERKGSMEWSVQFRIAHYLLEAIEPYRDGLFIDCEFNRNNTSPKAVPVPGNEGSVNVRPDIICHDRNSENVFIIEIKLGDDQNEIQEDIKKIHSVMSSLSYRYGYMISGMLIKNQEGVFNAKKVVIREFRLENHESSPDGERHEYRYCENCSRLLEGQGADPGLAPGNPSATGGTANIDTAPATLESRP